MKKLLLSTLLVLSTTSFAVSDFDLRQMNAAGNEVNFNSAEYPNAVFVIEAFFNGCHWCNVNAPNVDALAADFANNTRVHVLDVGIDRSDYQYQDWIRKHNPNHPVLKDAERSLIGQLGVSGYPTTLVIHQGQVKFRTSGSWSSADAKRVREAVISALLD